MKYSGKNHTFAICAFKESPYLEKCIQSLKEQIIRSNIILTTSTPCEYIQNLADKYEIPVFINTGEGGIAGDWNFAYSSANTQLVTIAHQDDFYMPQYTEKVLEKMNGAKKPLLCFTDYCEYKNKLVMSNQMLKIKRLLLLPFKVRGFENRIFIRRRVLSLGSPICCPSVTYLKRNLPKVVFKSGYRSDLDWQAWETLSKREGAFLYCAQVLMCHRIHEESATSEIIGDNQRTREDYEMFCKFWPRFIAKLLTRFYSKSQKLNDIEA